MRKRRVVIGVLGTVLDKRGKRANRFRKWRPTVGLCQQAEMPIDRLELLHQPRDIGMAQQLAEDVALVSPQTEVHPHAVAIANPRDFEEVYAAFLDFATRYPFDTDNEEYLVHITTGTHVAQICWFLLTEARYLPASLLQTGPAPKGATDEQIAAGTASVIDLDLSRYATLTSRFQREQQQSVSFLKDGIETRNATFNKLIDRIERVSLRSTDPILLTGPTGAGKSFLAKRIFQLRQSRHRWRVSLSPSTAPRCVAITPCRRYSATSKALLLARKRRVAACYARPMAACCFSMKLPNWASMNRRCC